MASVFPGNVLSSLLQALDSDPVPMLSGADLEGWSSGLLDSFLHEHLLSELAPVDETNTCDCATDGCHRTIQRDGAKAWAFCVSGLAAPLEMNPEHLRRFRIEMPVFCRMLREANKREANKLGGDTLTSYTQTVFYLGEVGSAQGPISLVLARCLHTRSAPPTLHATEVGGLGDPFLCSLQPRSLLDPGLRTDLKSKDLAVVTYPRCW